MKYLGVIAFLAALIWTWSVIHSDNPISFETHSGIQEKLAELIQTSVRAKRPAVTDVHIDKIWTELLSPGKVRAHFVYTFKEIVGDSTAPTTTTISGEGLLERQPDDGSGLDHWSLTQARPTNDSVIFEEGLIITGGSADSAPEASKSAPPSDKKSEH